MAWLTRAMETPWRLIVVTCLTATVNLIKLSTILQLWTTGRKNPEMPTNLQVKMMSTLMTLIRRTSKFSLVMFHQSRVQVQTDMLTMMLMRMNLARQSVL